MQAQDSAEPYEGSELFKLRHTAAHVMAQAVLDLFPGAKLGIGPPVTDGFYYDFDLGVDDTGTCPAIVVVVKSGVPVANKKSAPNWMITSMSSNAVSGTPNWPSVYDVVIPLDSACWRIESCLKRNLVVSSAGPSNLIHLTLPPVNKTPAIMTCTRSS